MTRKAFVKQADMKRMAAIVKEYGVRLEVEADGVILRISPDVSSNLYEAKQPQAPKRSFASQISPPVFKGPGGYPIVDNPDDPVKKWYDKLGFDPRTMGREDMKRLQNEADARWRASIPSKPLGKLERVALKQMAEHGPNKKVHWRDAKNLGIATGERLSARGFLQVVMHSEDPSRFDHYVLTDEGFKAWQKIQEEP